MSLRRREWTRRAAAWPLAARAQTGTAGDRVPNSASASEYPRRLPAYGGA